MHRQNQSSAYKETTPKPLFLGSLAPGTTELDIIQYIGQFGRINKAKIIRDVVTSVSKNCGLAFCEDEDTCWNVLSQPVHVMRNKTIRVNWADDNKKGTKKIHSNVIQVESVDPTLHPNTIFAHFAQFGPFVRSEVLREYTGRASKKRLPCLLKIQYESTWSVSEATKFQGEHFIKGIRVQCYVVLEPDHSQSYENQQSMGYSNEFRRTETHENEPQTEEYFEEEYTGNNHEFLDYRYQENYDQGMEDYSYSEEYPRSNENDAIEQPHLTSNGPIVRENSDFKAEHYQSGKNKSIYESRSTMKCSVNASGSFYEEFEQPVPEESELFPASGRPQTNSLVVKRPNVLLVAEEDSKSVGRSFDSTQRIYNKIDRDEGRQMKQEFAALSESETNHPYASSPDSFSHSSHLRPLRKVKMPEFVPLELKESSEHWDSVSQQTTDRKQSNFVRPESKLLLVEFEKDEIFAAFFKELKVVCQENTKFIKGLIHRGDMF